MKSLFRSLLEFISRHFTPPRSRPLGPVPPDQLRKAVQEMFADPEYRKVLLRDLVGSVLPIQGGATTPAADVCPGTFGTSCAPGDYGFNSNVGVGTASPSARLHVAGGHATITGGYTLKFDTGNVAPPSSTETSGTRVLLYPTGAGNHYSVGIESLHMWFNSAGGYKWYRATAPVMVLDTNGNLGIGATPSEKLHVVGHAAITGGNTLKFDTGNVAPPSSTETSGTRVLLFPTGASNHYSMGIESYHMWFNSAGGYKWYRAATPVMVLDTNGNLGIGTTAPAEKLDVAGKIKSEGLNQIVFLRPSGGDDGAVINEAIKNLSPPGSEKGGIIMLEPGSYNIQTKISNVDPVNPTPTYVKRGVKIRGYGGAGFMEVGFPVTELKWAGAPDGTIIELRSNDPWQTYQDFELSDLTIDGNGTAATGLVLDRVKSSKFINVHIQNLRKRTSTVQAPSTGIVLTTKAELPNGKNQGCIFNLFLNCSVFGADRGVILMSEADNNLPPGSGEPNLQAFKIANPAHNTFVGLSVWFYGDLVENEGVRLEDCDNNSFYRLWDCAIAPTLEPPPSSKGYAVVVERRSNAGSNYVLARSNYFYHLQAIGGRLAGGSFRVNALTTDEVRNPNLIFGLDLENTDQQPESTPDTNVARYVRWMDSKGHVHAFGPFGVGLKEAASDVWLQLPATTATQTQAPIRINNGTTGLSSPVDGTLEYFGNKLWFTVLGTRHELAPAGYRTVQDEGAALAQRSVLNFVGALLTASDDAANGRTNVTVSFTLNGLSGASQSFATGVAGTDFNISSAGSTHTFNLPDASTTARGAVTTGAQTFAGAKTFRSDLTVDNDTNSSAQLILDSGATAEQNSQLLLRDRGTDKWTCGKNALGRFFVFEAGVGDRMILVPGGANFYRSGSLANGHVFDMSDGTILAQMENPADGNVALLVRRNLGGGLTLQQVSMGAADSGGAGFRVLRVPN